jgi:catechol 2,3-dioxygenase-like lactoylglutathione lyase family enzyme
VSSRIGNIAIHVSDLDGSERFYVDGLGLEVTARIETDEVREVIVGSATGGSELMLAVRADGTQPVEPDAGIWKVFVHTDDAAEAYRRALAAGAEPVAEPELLDRFGITIAMVRDPDGYLIELGQMAR